ncbi:hypothetical protein TCAL_07650 [Tigriopus californicus]|uniref:Corticotropin-releasing factor domain-containing protein n=1 Tax=Tigriopus californicus TaxID=6832 RepID=A0A553NNE0_TIGCA|nr:hypothetical protein TCAL_07650 [Tigriopus californicus]
MVPDRALTCLFFVVISDHVFSAPAEQPKSVPTFSAQGSVPRFVDPGVGDPLSFLSSSSVSSHTSRVRRSPLEFSHPLHIGSSISYFRSPAEIQPTSMSYAPSRPRNRIQTRRTLPFQLVSQPLLGYAHSRSYVDQSDPRTRASAHRTRAKAADILSMLNSLTEDLQNQKHRLRFGFF